MGDDTQNDLSRRRKIRATRTHTRPPKKSKFSEVLESSVNEAMSDGDSVAKWNDRMFEAGLKRDMFSEGSGVITMMITLCAAKAVKNGASPSDLRAMFIAAFESEESIEHPERSLLGVALRALRSLCRFENPDQTTLIDLAMTLATVSFEALDVAGIPAGEYPA